MAKVWTTDFVAVDDGILDANSGYMLVAINISGTNIWAVAHPGEGKDGWIFSVTIGDDGSVSAVIDSLEFNSTECNDATGLIYISGTVYAITYQGLGNDGYITTFNMNADGTFGAVIETVEFDSTEGRDPVICPIQGGTKYGILSSQGATSPTILYTWDITNAGDIAAAATDSSQITATGYEPSMTFMHISGTIYLIGYYDTTVGGYVFKTISIAADGTIGAVQDTLTLTGQQEARVRNIAGTIYAIASIDVIGGDQAGLLETYSISAAGVFSAQIDSGYFADVAQECYVLSDITWLRDDFYAIIFQDGPADGQAEAVRISSGGIITLNQATIAFQEAFAPWGIRSAHIYSDDDSAMVATFYSGNNGLEVTTFEFTYTETEIIASSLEATDIPGLVLSLPLIEGAGDTCYDNGPFANNGTLSKSGGVYPQWEETGKYDTFCLDFDGVGSYVDCKTKHLPKGNREITLEAWFKNTTSVAAHEYILGYGNWGNNGQSFAMGIRSTDVLFATFYGASYDVISLTSYIKNVWNHLVAVHSGDGVVEIYLNGVSVFSDDVDTPNITPSACAIGSVPDGSASYFDGMINGARIYKKALTAEEVFVRYSGGRLVAI